MTSLPLPPQLSPEPVTDDLYRRAFRDHAARVVVVTAAGENGPVGFTATSLTSVSLDPPMVSFALARSASAWPGVSVASRVAVHLLARGQDALARTFATSGIDRFADVSWHPGDSGEPLLDDCAAYLCCDVVAHVPAGDHAMVLAEVTAAYVGDAGPPLLYHAGSYASVAPIAARPRPIRSVPS